MEQSDPGVTEGGQRRGSRLWLLVLGFSLVLSVYTAISTMQRRQHMAEMVDQLGASDAQDRAAAIDYLFDGSAYESGRLADSRRAQSRLEDASGAFSDAALAQLFDEVISPREGEWLALSRSAPLTFYRSIIAAMERSGRDGDVRHDTLMKLDLALQNGMRETANGLEYGLVFELADQDERELILDTLVAINEAAATDPEPGPANIATLTTISLTGAAGLGVLEPMLDAASDEARREAWLQLAVLRPESGYTARWQDAPRSVAEAMIAASVLMSGDATAAIERFRADERVASGYGEVLDALELLTRDAEGRITLTGTEWSELGSDAAILEDLSNAHDLISGSQWRFRALRNRSGLAAGQ